MSITEYAVGLVVPRCGLSERQLAEVTRRIRETAGLMHPEGVLTLLVPGFESGATQDGVPAEVLNLRRLSKVRLRTYVVRSRDGETAARIVADMELARADEVWCCPEMTHTGRSQARANQVYALGTARSRPGRYKKIPPWVEGPGPEVQKKATAKKTMKGPLW